MASYFVTTRADALTGNHTEVHKVHFGIPESLPAAISDITAKTQAPLTLFQVVPLHGMLCRRIYPNLIFSSVPGPR
jgi:hypothetical protein